VLAPFGVDWRVALFTGFLVAMSSTTVMLQVLAQRGESQTPQAEAGLGVSLFQDVASVVMVLLVPALAGQGGSPLEVAWALAKAALIIALVLVVARRLMPPVLEAVARTGSPAPFLLTITAICSGTAWRGRMAGV